MRDKRIEMLSVSGGTIKYTIIGEGPLLILVCTLSGSWAAQVREFANNYTVVTYDMRGFGDSLSENGYPSNEQHAEDLYQLIEHLDLGRPVLVGLSHGGIILQHFAHRYDRMALGYIFVATLAKAVGQTRLLLELLQRFLGRAEGDNFWEVLRTFLISEKNYDQVMSKEKLLRRLMFNQFKVTCLDDIYSGALKHDSTPWLNTITSLCWVIGGEHDILFPRQTIDLLAQGLSHSEVKYIDCAHLPPVESPKTFNQLVLEFCQLVQK